MKNKSPKNRRPRSPSGDRAASSTRSRARHEASNDVISASEMERILMNARQTVKPIVKREAKNEIVSEEVLSFKMERH